VRASKFPLILAANRDEDYDRPTLPADFWADAPDILGGRDALHLGSWLAITKGGRFAAVTNLRGSVRDPRKRSRGELVSAFVRGDTPPRQYMDDVVARADAYAGFHLIAGEVGGDVVQGGSTPSRSIAGLYALSNALPGERWPKVDVAQDELRRLVLLENSDELIAETLQFLVARRGTNHAQSEIFVAGERHGTRSSTVIVASTDHITFVEQAYARHGVPDSEPRRFRFAISMR
jgi:uncharacterized protein with NRDE domain